MHPLSGRAQHHCVTLLELLRDGGCAEQGDGGGMHNVMMGFHIRTFDPESFMDVVWPRKAGRTASQGMTGLGDSGGRGDVGGWSILILGTRPIFFVTMFLPTLQRHSNYLERRSNNNNIKDSTSAKIPIIVRFFSSVAIAFLAFIIVVLCIFYFLRALRYSNAEPRYIPTEYLKNKWRNWLPKTAYGQVPDAVPDAVPATQQARANRSQNTSYRGAGDDGVDRNTSIRSVMTLPTYSPVPKPTEQVIGREGERAGMDVVVEFPETAEEEESRREEQMESLYQIRLARRQEIAERERRRQERRDARERGDWERLEELRRESRARHRNASQSSAAPSAAALIAEHQSRGREKRVTSVAYAEVGHVRHDGTRLRASSQESDSRPLLDGNSSLSSLSGSRPRATSGSSFFSNATSQSDNDTPRGSITLAEADIGDSNIHQPPHYDQLDWGDAPAYRSPTFERGLEPRFPPSSPMLNAPTVAVEFQLILFSH
ncbi:hypothetical protein I7I51_01342 [Histoplasma capsulatum]|uniref:Uncharacterized protein n=1 Tax=Ajellomyces capsulatus TaxID=5037 RepID=A0A8A1MJJ3_AJECA|nr:hypothetical protein I7I51_01342 [Histoplasma capsulatum]